MKEKNKVFAMPMQMPILIPMLMSIYRCQDLQMAFFNPVTTPKRCSIKNRYQKTDIKKSKTKVKAISRDFLPMPL